MKCTFRQPLRLFSFPDIIQQSKHDKAKQCKALNLLLFPITGFPMGSPFERHLTASPQLNSLLTISRSKILPIKIPNKRSSLPESYIGDAMSPSCRRDHRETFPGKIAECFVAQIFWPFGAFENVGVGGLINIKTCCMGLERTHLIWDAEYMVRPELAAPAPPLWPQCLRGRMIVWSGKELFVIARLTRSTVDTVSLQTIGETRSAQWLLSSAHIFPMKTFAEKWRCKTFPTTSWLVCWLFSEKNLLL